MISYICIYISQYDYDFEAKKNFLRGGFKIKNDNLYFKRLFRQLKENLIEIKYRTIKMKRDILMGLKKSEWDLVDDLMEELKDEIYPEGKSESFPVETFYDNEQEMLKKVFKMREQLNEERWILRTKE